MPSREFLAHWYHRIAALSRLELEWIGVAAVIALALILPELCSPVAFAARAVVDRVAARRRLSVVLVGIVGFASSAFLFELLPTPPRVHDEFSYLLAADTFASGRLTNPTHPHWEHFESFHILQQPTYQSKFPPLPAVPLALAQLAAGDPRIGVWLAMGLACAALCWMLQAWVSPRWALVVSLLAAIRLGVLLEGLFFAYWGRQFWGGAVPMLGGALLYGGLRRLADAPRTGASLAFGFGLVVLAGSRPYEGMLVSLPAAAGLAWVLWRGRANWSASARRVVVPLAIVLITGAAAGGLYNYRVSGAAWRFPYLEYEKHYGVGPSGHFTSDVHGAGTAAENTQMRNYYGSWPEKHTRSRSEILRRLQGFMLGPALTPLLLMIPWVGSDRWRWVALGGGLLVLSQGFLLRWFLPHYAAPALCVLYLLVAAGFERLSAVRLFGRPFGRCGAVGLPLLCVASYGLLATAKPPRVGNPSWYHYRAAIEEELLSEPGSHLVFVHYDVGHNPNKEWVYNGADIDASRVVWARELDEVRDRSLREYYAERSAWVVKADKVPPRLAPLP